MSISCCSNLVHVCFYFVRLLTSLHKRRSENLIDSPLSSLTRIHLQENEQRLARKNKELENCIAGVYIFQALCPLDIIPSCCFYF